MLRKLFVEHPESVGETYLEHMGVAFGFGFSMLGAAMACIVHGLVPGLFKSTGSKAIIALHNRLVTNRSCKTQDQGKRKAAEQGDFSQAIAFASQPAVDFTI